MTLPRSLALAALALALTAPAAQAEASLQDQIYDPLCVSRISLTAPPESIEHLYEDPKGDYQPGTMTFDLCGAGTQVFGPSPVTFRLKGSGSFRTLDQKAAFKVKMPSGSRIDGLKSFTLNNMVQDLSAIHEVLGFEAYRAAGVAAPRAGYATVTLNGADYGLHANVETIDSRFLAEHFDSTEHLYEAPDWEKGHATHASRDILPDAVDAFEVDEGDDDDVADLTALAAMSQIDDDDAWWAAFQAAFDEQQVFKFLAVEAFIGNHDGYAYNVNNYYLHSDETGLFNFLPWGLDKSFTEDLPLDGSLRAGVVARRCAEHSQCQAQYMAALDGAAKAVIGINLPGRARAVNTAIAAAFAADTRREMTLLDQCLAVNDTIAFLAARETLWNDEFRQPGDPAVTNPAEPVECAQFAPKPDPPLDAPAADVIAPRLLGIRVRRTSDASARVGPRSRSTYRFHVRATDDRGVASVQIRTLSRHTHTRPYGARGSVTLSTAAKRVRVRVLDAAGNKSAWTTVQLPR